METCLNSLRAIEPGLTSLFLSIASNMYSRMQAKKALRIHISVLCVVRRAKFENSFDEIPKVNQIVTTIV